MLLLPASNCRIGEPHAADNGMGQGSPMLTIDEADVIADAFETAANMLDLELDVVASREVNLLRGIVIVMARRQHAEASYLDGDDVILIADAAVRLYELFGRHRW
jgi:hypothetical protein